MKIKYLILFFALAFCSCSKNDALEGEVPYTVITSEESVVGSGNNVVANFFVSVTEEIASDPRNLLIVSRIIRGDRLDPINTYFFTSAETISPDLAKQWLIIDPKLNSYNGKVLGSFSETEKRYYYTYIPFKEGQSVNVTEIIN